jgi:CP family cyanate transporter-like MFS transporter
VSRRRLILVAAGIVLAGLNLRMAVANVPPILDEITGALSLSATAGGVLTAAPVVCFGAFAPAAPLLARRFGGEVVLVGALAALAAGSLLRAGGDRLALYAGTVVAGAAVAVGNVLVPALIRTRFARVGALTGLYAASLGIGAALAAAATVPVAEDVGWRGALAVWAVPAFLAAAVLAFGARPERLDVHPLRARLMQDRVAWLVTAYMGLQSLVFYAMFSWLPSILRDHGYGAGEAGAMLALVALAGIPASLLAPVVATRMRDERVVAAALPLLEAVAIAGLLVAPGAAYAWVAAFAVGQGGAFAVALTLIGVRASETRPVAELSGMAQSVGYSIAALGPFALGALHDATGGWDVPLYALLAAVAGLAAAGVSAGAPVAPHEPGLIGVDRG